MKRLLKKIIPSGIQRSVLFVALNQWLQISVPKFFMFCVDKIYSYMNPEGFLVREARKYDNIFYADLLSRMEAAEKREREMSIFDDIKRCYNFNSVIDVGCGYGIFVKRCLDAGYDAFGVDISRRAIEECMHRTGKPGRFSTVLSSRLPFEDGQFDLVVSLFLLEHLPTVYVQSTLREMSRVSRRHTFHIITLGKSAKLNKREFHLTVRNDIWWRKQFEKAGFKIRRKDIEQDIYERNKLISCDKKRRIFAYDKAQLKSL